MDEWRLVFFVPVRLLIVLVFALLYAVGGRDGSKKLVRRFIGGGFFGGALILLALVLGVFKWWLVFAPATYIIALCLGYGGDTAGVKFVRRLVYGLALGACAVLVASTTGTWTLGFFQLGLAAFSSVFLGLTNPIKAVNEEALVATLSVVCVPFLV